MGFSRAFMLDMIPQVVATVLGTLMAVSDGMTYGWTSPMIPYFMSNSSHIEMSENDADWMETINLLGYAAGLPFTILSVDHLGRKISMILSALLGCLCWILLLIAEDIKLLYVSRFMAGMAGDMCFVAAPMYIAEISDYRIRGFLSSLIYFMMIVGIVVVYCTGSLAPYWVTPAVGIILTAAQSAFVIFLPESPYYYVYKNKYEKARKALRRLRAHEDLDAEMKEIQQEVEREKTEKGRPQDLVLIKSNRKALLITLLLNGAQHFVGISVFLMNLQLILEQAGSEYIESTTASIIFAVIMLLSTGAASTIIDKYGRRFLLITSSLLTGFSLLAMTIFFHLQYNNYDVAAASWIPAASVMVYAATFKVGLGLVPIVVIAEIFPTTVKALGMTLSDVMYVMAAVVSIYMYQLLSGHYGLHVPLYIFTVCSFAMVGFTLMWLPETKGKTLDEIQMMLKGELVEQKEKKKQKKIDENRV
ncbi:facilitated trehalose transporter Tret1-like [Anthonomus grandis grandis]|uniref:facilitated trehalose transporter Tret1-like n=1 Tax=Anthonomus grandis grandis TaxID=2921223 RepID=UPI0021654786|nr:facilitated trehalose transporter Tret1-like [Anthonomus grandis grandis]